jgi:hypothetical protein
VCPFFGKVLLLTQEEMDTWDLPLFQGLRQNLIEYPDIFNPIVYSNDYRQVNAYTWSWLFPGVASLPTLTQHHLGLPMQILTFCHPLVGMRNRVLQTITTGCQCYPTHGSSL